MKKGFFFAAAEETFFKDGMSCWGLAPVDEGGKKRQLGVSGTFDD